MCIELPKQGSSRVVKRFAVFPITAGNYCVLWKICYIRQYYDTIRGWSNEYFVSEDTYKEFRDKHIHFE